MSKQCSTQDQPISTHCSTQDQPISTQCSTQDQPSSSFPFSVSDTALQSF